MSRCSRTELIVFTGIGILLGWMAKSDRACRLEKSRAEQRAEREFRRGIMDPLTRAFNRRYMETVLNEWWARATAGGEHFSLLMVDLDRFKFINDRYGHSAGDRVLQTAAQTILHHTRASDYLFRYGGDEFLLLLPQTGFDRALRLAHRLRTEMGKLAFPGPDQARFNADFSAGVIEYSSEIKSLAEMLDRLDQSLYQAKQELAPRSLPASS